jgi:tetratricopeptide (TPR) repeat protein
MYKHKLFFIIIASIFLTISCASSSEAEDALATLKPKTPPKEAITKAEELYKERKNPDKVREAIKTLEQTRDMDNRNYEVEWKYARMNYFLGSRKNTPESEADKALERGLTAAKIAKRLEPKKPDGHFWYAAILGEQAKRSPITVGVTSVNDIKSSMLKVIEIEPGYQGASAYDGLGQLEMGTQNFGGSAEKAIEYFEKALELDDENAYIYLHLAEAYIATGNQDKARQMLDKLFNLKPDPDFLPEYEEAEADGKKLLKDKL